MCARGPSTHSAGDTPVEGSTSVTLHCLCRPPPLWFRARGLTAPALCGPTPGYSQHTHTGRLKPGFVHGAVGRRSAISQRNRRS